MIYRVNVLRLAARDLEEAALWTAARAPLTAARWLDRFEGTINNLANNPLQWPLAPEARKVHREIRQRLFGRRTGVYRVLFVVEGQTVKVLRILRAQKRTLTSGQIRKALEPDE